MAETTKIAKSDDHDAPATKSTARPVADPSRHAASSDPAVHKLLADRQGHVSTLEALTKPADPDAVKVVEGKIAEIDKRLADL